MKGSLIEKDGYLYVVIGYKNEDGVRKNKWVATGLTAKGNRRAGQDMMKQILEEFEESGIATAPARPKIVPDKAVTEKQLATPPKEAPHPQMAQGPQSDVHTRKNTDPAKVYSPTPLPETDNSEGEVLFSDFMRNWLKM